MKLTEEILEAQFQDDRDAAFDLVLALEAVLRGSDIYTTLKALSVTLATKLAYFAGPKNFDELTALYLRVQREDIEGARKVVYGKFTP